MPILRLEATQANHTAKVSATAPTLWSCGEGWAYYIYILTCPSRSSILSMGWNLSLCATVFFNPLFKARQVGIEPELLSCHIKLTSLHQNSEVVARIEGIIFIF